MLPTHVAENVRRQILYYLQSTFEFRDRRVAMAFERFLLDPDRGLFKGPWAHVRRPFRVADAGAEIPFDITPPMRPFVHQLRAWRRLSSRDRQPESTVITTGTGSGKTECFLYPLLDHCLRARREGQPGIKAIVLYPMNALAADQERRFARTIWNSHELKAAGIRVGNYTGRYDPQAPGSADSSGHPGMGPDHGVTRHETQQEHPPDILLTNYRMLDFLLMRPQDQGLWQHNAPGVLRYLVLDELHTYDGAQGSDVACLIRRLKERLGVRRGGLCVVGTSATLDSHEPVTDQSGAGVPVDAMEDSTERLARFASTLFEEEIAVDAVVGEERLGVDEIVHPEAKDRELPSVSACEPLFDESAAAYAVRQSAAWGGPVPAVADDASTADRQKAATAWALELGDWLKRTVLFRRLLEAISKAEQKREDPLGWDDLVARLTRADLALANIPRLVDREAILGSFFALVAFAREERSGNAFPLVPSQVQLWVRELRRVGRLATDTPMFGWLDEPINDLRSLPAFHCSECGESGWMALHDPQDDTTIRAKGVNGIHLASAASEIYAGWFGDHGGRSPRIVLLSPYPELEAADGREAADGGGVREPASRVDAYAQHVLAIEHDYLCQQSLVLRKGDGGCPLTGDSRRFRVRVNRDTRDREGGGKVGDQGCPNCGSRIGVFIIGSQAATLSSLAIDEVFGSLLNDDPKLLAFTDSVQDASHRAGFFTSRTYNFTFRTALQHVVDAAGDAGLPIVDAGRRLLEFWSAAGAGRPGSLREAMAALMPPDLIAYGPWIEYRDDATAVTPPAELRHEIEQRLAWGATSEFSLMQTHGRTLEVTGTAALGWEVEVLAAALRALRARLPGVSPHIAELDDAQLRLWMLGLLHRYRERGALAHGYLDDYARANFWGKYPFGRTVPGRETYPSSIRYRPRLLVTRPLAGHEHVLAETRGGLSPWHLVWTRRVLGQPGTDEATLLDLMQCFLDAGAGAGLLTRLHTDGNRAFYALAASAARLHADCAHLKCSESGRSLVRPMVEADAWEQAPSLEYHAHAGRYAQQPCDARQTYYQDRYRKGALRRVVAREHTGLLATEERETLERDFAAGAHADAPNVLTCTSTLEMGIDIGDLSSTMLCSMPPTTASYLQRIGRAGRATGTALVVSVVNQRPHDLFFFARPAEMLKGSIEPPGCWLDASAVLVRQFLGFCFDSATAAGELTLLPRTARQMEEDLDRSDGHLPRMMAWVAANEDELRERFLARFRTGIQPDTRERFVTDTAAELLLQRMHVAAQEFARRRKDLSNARARLNEQAASLTEEEQEAREEIERELHILRGRLAALDRTTSLEVLTDHGLLPNYAFPERGVRFFGAVYNRHRRAQQEHRPIELLRAAGPALKELAPHNWFYTHSRQFEIQQLAIGSPQQPLFENWAVCGRCGHMRTVEALQRADAPVACPQCGHDGDSLSQHDVGQQRSFIHFAESQALSYMEHYESLSGDSSEERERTLYQTLKVFDQTVEAPRGAVGDDTLPFGIEYRAAMGMREVNVGYAGQPGVVAFGPELTAPEPGFQVCRHCGIVAPQRGSPDLKLHRRSCQARRRAEKLTQEGRAAAAVFEWEPVYLYRSLRSEALRLLLPLVDDEDIDTLSACIYLGMRLRFEGDPAHLIVAPQVMPDSAQSVQRRYLVLMDAVPGGTGYLKSLYQEKDAAGRPAEGLVDVLRRARDALETCTCRRMKSGEEEDDTDGCYRCIRTYHLQYTADSISRERGIRLLGSLIEACERRVERHALDDIRPDSLLGSVLEKKFVDRLRSYVEERQGSWEKTVIKGTQGFRFSLPDSSRVWEVELQPKLGAAQGVAVASQPDFMLRPDDPNIRPIAVFTDGFEFHCHPHNRLSDDLAKRRALLESGHHHVWSITWDDLDPAMAGHLMVASSTVANVTNVFATHLAGQGHVLRTPVRVLRNGMVQLLAFLEAPDAETWSRVAEFVAFWPLQEIASHRTVPLAALEAAIAEWREGASLRPLAHTDGGEWIYIDRATLETDVVTVARLEDVVNRSRGQVVVLARLGDTEGEVTASTFKERWRRFLAAVNLFQHCGRFMVWATSETVAGAAPDILLGPRESVDPGWAEIRAAVTPSVAGIVQALADAGAALPVIEYFNDEIDDDAFAELAWPERSPRVALLAGEQADFAPQWQRLGWKVVVADEAASGGLQRLLALVAAREGED